ncbi:MAG TPA: metallopeptidase family protein [Verrucomicrobium sp.]|nr:metallopeptidase family protein [Verrucomicrobium sp.]
MLFPALLRLAEIEVERVMTRLPEDVREAAGECMVTFETAADSLDAGEADSGNGDDGDVSELLGLFEGFSRLDPEPAGPEEMPRVRLFLDNLWDFAEGDEQEYRREVRITYLHELGHYLGWGEEEVEALGLG